MAASGPVFASTAEYAARLDDVQFWEPHVRRALAHHGLPADHLVAGTVGTYPTFLTDSHVVKLFGDMFTGGASFAAEVAVHGLLACHPDIPAAQFVGHGHLFNAGWPWPYHITTRLDGMPWNKASLSPEAAVTIAHQLGRVVRRLHLVEPPSAVRGPETLARLRSDCVSRLTARGSLPPPLLAQVEAYMLPPSQERRLVHADLHGDHIFVEGARLVGIIDWGDAVVGDPYYELPALHLGTFRGDKRLLRAFLDGYGWPVSADFARRAMSMTLLHEFNVLVDLAEPLDVALVGSPDQLAEKLWGPD